MIIATIDQGIHKKSNEILFRGKEVSYWIVQFNSELFFHSISEIPEDFTYLFLFSSATLSIPIPFSRIEQITEFLNINRPQQEELFTFPNFPFFVLTRKFFLAYNDSFQNGIFKKLCDSKKFNFFPFNHTEAILDPLKMPLETEKMIVEFQINRMLKRQVQILDFNHFYIEGNIPIGSHSIISSGTSIIGNSTIGNNVRMYPNCYIENSHIGDQCILLPGSIILDSKIENNVQVGPYAHIRNGTVIKSGAKVGNFVEMKKSSFGEDSKAMHLSYIGDATVGKSVNIGAGTITCNFDGEKKNTTIIEDKTFIGSGTELIAPVTVHKNSYVAAGSTINQDVPENSLAIARARQINILDWVFRKKKKT